MAALVTLASVVIAFPIAYFAARYARGRWKALFYLGGDAAALVELPGQDLRLEDDPRQGGHRLLGCSSGCTSAGSSTRCSALPVIGGPSLSVSYLGTFLVFVYVWLPFMILPMQAALERVPASLLEASADLGAGAAARPSATSSCRWRSPASSPARSSPSR